MGTKKVTVTHKRNSCIGCGYCALLAPDTWSMNHMDGKSDLKNSTWKGNQFVIGTIEDAFEENIEAEKACPMKIIRVHITKTKQ